MLKYISSSNIGQRKNNDDSVLTQKLDDDLFLFVVCDGVGGNAPAAGPGPFFSGA